MAETELPLVVFTYGRMNPPHSGHMGLLKEMIHTAISEGGTQVVVLLSSSKDPAKNPIECRQKKELALEREMIEKAKSDLGEPAERIQINVYCPEDLGTSNSVSAMIKAAVKQIYGDDTMVRLVMLVGEDRASQFDWIGKSVKPHIFESRFSDRPEGGISATRIRGHVSSGNERAFMEDMADTGLSEESMMELYGAISTGLSSPDTKKATKPRTSKKMSIPSTSISTFTATRKGKPTKKEDDDEDEEEVLPQKSVRKGGKLMKRSRRTSTKRRICRKKHKHTKRCRM